MMPDKLQRFSRDVVTVLSLSNAVATAASTKTMDIMYIFLGLLLADDTDAKEVLQYFDMTEQKVRDYLKLSDMEIGAHSADMRGMDLPIEVKRMLEKTTDYARQWSSDTIDTLAMLAGVLSTESESLDTMLQHFNVERDAILDYIETYRKDNEQ